MARPLPQLTGKKFNRWTVLGIGKFTNRASFWICRCSCGVVKSVRHAGLTRGTSGSCGCLQKELIQERSVKHGMYRTPTYFSWVSMKSRCLYKSHVQYKNYGGRGISVCASWMKFENFFEDMGDRPIGGTLYRIDNKMGYEPGNCRWATKKEQNNNVRRKRTITFNGKP